MELEVQHTTHFRYPSPVHDSFNETRLQPVSNLTQERLSFALEVNPAARPGEYRDFYQNVVHYFEVTQPHTELKVTARSRVRTGVDGWSCAEKIHYSGAFARLFAGKSVCEFAS